MNKRKPPSRRCSMDAMLTSSHACGSDFQRTLVPSSLSFGQRIGGHGAHLTLGPRHQRLPACESRRVHHQQIAQRLFKDDAKHLGRASWTLEPDLVTQEPLSRASEVRREGACGQSSPSPPQRTASGREAYGHGCTSVDRGAMEWNSCVVGIVVTTRALFAVFPAFILVDAWAT